MQVNRLRMGLVLWLIMASVLAALGPEPAAATPVPPPATSTPTLIPATPAATPPATPPAPTAPSTATPPATPPAPTITPAFSVRINEFFAAPAAGGQEFVELINLGPGPANLGGWQIDDIPSGGSAPRTIPANTVVPAGGLTVINLSNVLNNGGDEVRLLDPAGLPVDAHAYAAATAGLSASRLPDGSGGWVDGTPPTPGALNLLPIVTPTVAPPTVVPTTTATPTAPPLPAAVALNEYLAAPAAGGQEFVEVINLGPEPVDLSGWRLRDAAGNTRAFTLPALLPGQIHALRFASGYLNNSAETIELLAAGGAVADSVSYASAPPGRSASRLPDGAGPWVDGTAPTPDAPNQPLPPPPAFTVRLNEFLAAPISGTEFIELYNLGPDPAALDGWRLDDLAGGGAAPKAIPAGTVIPAGGFWVFPVSSMLNNDGDELRLLDPAGAVTDAFTYTASLGGLSVSRLPDGSGDWSAGTPPTPGEPNRPAEPPPPAPDFRVTINEFLAAPISGTEFIELYNLGPDPAALDGWRLDDVAGGGAAPKAIPAGTVIPAGGFWAFPVSSMLNNDGDSISLIAPSGGISDTVSYTATLAGLSASRLPDGLGEWTAGTPPTPAAPNAAPPPPPPPAVFSVVLNEYFAVPFSGGAEFIELYNLGPDQADVGGWRIDDSSDSGGAPHAIPAGTVIPAGGWWTWYIAGPYLNNAGDEVRLLDAAGALRDSLRYDSAVAGLSASRLPDGSGSWTAGTPTTPDGANRGPDALPSGLFLNEFVPHPPKGQPEWIELYSTYTATIDLTGWQLDDVAGGSKPMRIPSGTLIEPGEWVRIVLSSNLLNDGGDQVRLLAPDGSVIDSASYGKIKHHNSLSRLPDGLGPWYNATPLTPDAANQPLPEPAPAAEQAPGSAARPGALLISEVVYDVPADRDENNNEWVEITNPTTATVIVEGWALRDNKAASPLPRLEVAPGEVVVLAATAELLGFYPAFSGTFALVGSPKLGNGLGNNGDQLLLLDGTGAVVDAMSWGDNTAVFDPAAPDVPTGHSLQRQPAVGDSDSAADWAGSSDPSPGNLSAGSPAPPPAPAAPDMAPPTTAAPGAVLISQVMYDPRSPIQEPGGEWLELLNTTPATLTLSGWTVADGRASDDLPLLTLAPGEIALVAASDSVSATYRLTGQVVTLGDGSLGGGLNNGGDSVTLRDGAGTLIDALSWGDDMRVFDPAAPDVAEGSSLLREPPDADSDSAADWVVQPAAAPLGAEVIERPPWVLPAASSVILSEVLPAPRAADWDGDGTADRADEWVELVNLGDSAVDLGGWSLDDLADGGSQPYLIPAGTLIEPGGFLVLFAASTGLSLNNSGLEQVRLLRPDGALADLLEYRSSRPDRSWSRVPSPRGEWAGNSLPSPGAPNGSSQPGAPGLPFGAPLPIGSLGALPLTATAVISGVVTVRPDVLRKNAFYVQDSSGGVMVLLKSTLAWPELEPGRRVSLRGKLSTFRGELQIKANALDDLVLGEASAEVAPLLVRGAAIGPANVGQLVQVRGSYLKAAGRDMLILAADGTTVRVHPPSGMKKPRYRKGAPISAVGIVGRYDATIRLQLRSLADLGVVGGLPDTGGGRPWPWFWVIPALIGGGVALRWRARA